MTNIGMRTFAFRKANKKDAVIWGY